MISAIEFVKHAYLSQGSIEGLGFCLAPTVCAIDVRSEGEFDTGLLPGSVNLPILNNAERHLVGTCYKKQGQECAIKLGYDLVSPNRATRTKAWCAKFAMSEPSAIRILFCWRGGLRSKIAQEWVRSEGMNALRIDGGFKAVRHLFMDALRVENAPPVIVLSGYTGARKTELLNSLPNSAANKMDLEGLAHHKGSAFGRNLLNPQPSQVTFENKMAIEILKFKNQAHQMPVFLEDESKRIGDRVLPLGYKEMMLKAPVVVLDASLEERAYFISKSYVIDEMARGISMSILMNYFLSSIDRIEKKAGSEVANRLRKKIKQVFEDEMLVTKTENHIDWVSDLLKHYYDPMYLYSFTKHPRNVVFKGDFNAVRQYILDKGNQV